MQYQMLCILTAVLAMPNSCCLQETQHKTGTRWQDTDEISGTFLGIGPAASTSESDQYEIDPGQTLLWFEVQSSDEV